jgi:hypothetical protein
MSGMVGAMLVCLAVILAFVTFRALNRTEVEVTPDTIDHLAVVEGVQAGGEKIAYPAELPDGWRATRAAFESGPGRVWALSLLTDDDEFVGVRQLMAADPDSVGDLVEKYVDADAEEGEPVRLDGSLAPEWRTFSDSGGDHALVAPVGGTLLLVVGSAPEAQVEQLTAALVTAPVP